MQNGVQFITGNALSPCMMRTGDGLPITSDIRMIKRRFNLLVTSRPSDFVQRRAECIHPTRLTYAHETDENTYSM